MKIEYYMIEKQYKSGKIRYRAVPVVVHDADKTISYPMKGLDYCCDKLKDFVGGGDWTFGQPFDGKEWNGTDEVDTNVNMTECDSHYDSYTYITIYYCPFCGEKIETVNAGMKVLKQKTRKVKKEVYVTNKKTVEEDESYWD